MSSTGRGIVTHAVHRVALACLLVLPPMSLFAVPSEAQSPPLTYSAISDRLVRQYPPLPALGSAGYQFTDPAFGSKMLRATDANTRPDRVGRAWFSPSSAETSAWNTNSTKFYVTGGGGEQIPFNFNPTTMAVSRIGNTSNGSGGLVLNFDGEPNFSFVDPDLIYGQVNGTQLVSYRFSTAVQTVIHDETSCLPGVATHTGRGISVTSNDQRFLDYVGGSAQDLDTTVYVYDRTLGCRWLNIVTGQVGGQWGPTGSLTGADIGWTLHNARMSKGGDWVKITDAGGSVAGLYFWQVSTLTVYPCNVYTNPPLCDGHQVMGYQDWVNQRGLGDGMDFAIRPMNNPNAATSIIVPLLTPAQYMNDTHVSWSNVQSDEKEPVCTEAYRTDDLVQRAWDGEIICMEMDGVASTVWRFAHHRSHVVTFGDQPRANLSQDGRFLLFTSNWEQTLGTVPVSDGGGLRDDAFVVELAPPRTIGPSAPTNLTLQ